MLILVSYDIIDDYRRTKLAKKLLDWGQRVQYSVFECELTTAQFAEMKKKMPKLFNLFALKEKNLALL